MENGGPVLETFFPWKITVNHWCSEGLPEDYMPEQLYKAPTTPENLTIGIMNTIDALSKLCGLDRKQLLGQTTTMVNGTTAGTNAVITKQGAKLGIICTKGFPDVIELRRVPKVDMFNWRMPFPKPLVPRPTHSFPCSGSIRAAAMLQLLIL